MAAVNVARTVAAAGVGAWLLVAAVPWAESRRAGPLGLIAHPHITAITAVPMATAATLVLMRRHMSIFDTPKDSLSIESRHSPIGSRVIRGNGARGLEATRQPDVTVKARHKTHILIQWPYSS
jgi:hypothetical protein